LPQLEPEWCGPEGGDAIGRRREPGAAASVALDPQPRASRKGERDDHSDGDDQNDRAHGTIMPPGASRQDVGMTEERYACAECGFERELETTEAVGPAIVEGVARIAEIMRTGDPALHERRTPEFWSPLEYGAHLRDVLLVQRERVLMARRMDRPTFEPMGRDERVEHDGYADQDPDDVARQLMDAAAMFANDLDRLTASDWDRTVVYNYPKTWERPLRWVAVHTLHEVRHHAMDIERQMGD
jgi:hypothetical protein